MSLPRRDFLTSLTFLGMGSALGCARGGTMLIEPVVIPGIAISPTKIVIELGLVPELSTVPAFFRLSRITTLVLRTGSTDYRAFSAVCTHAGCSVSRFEAGRMVCPCHLSEYDLDGVPVAGPAPLPMTRLATALDDSLRFLTISRLPSASA